MVSPDQQRPLVRFGAFELDGRAMELRRNGRRVPLQIQQIRVLDMLVENAGQVVTREQLRERVWPATVHLDFDHGLNNAINWLRKFLEDSSESPCYIETLPRIGYRFIHPVEAVPDVPTSVRAEERSPRRRRPAWAAPLVAIAAGLVLVWLIGSGRHSGPVTEVELSETTQSRDAYLRGRHLWNQRNKESVAQSIEYFRQAIDLDPGNALAYVGLAEAFATAGGNSLVQSMNADDALPHALSAAHRALQLDQNSAEAHAALGQVLDKLQPWSAENDTIIESEYRLAIALAPEYSNARLWYGNFLSVRQRNREAISQFRRALVLDPLSGSINSRLGIELFDTGSTEEGLQLLEKTVQVEPWQFNARVRLGWAYASLDRYADADEEFRIAGEISPASPTALAGQAFVAARRGDKARALLLLGPLEEAADTLSNPFHVAIVYVGLQDTDNAIEWLAKTAQSSSRVLHKVGPYGLGSALYDWLRDDPRFAEIQQNVENGPFRPAADPKSL